MLTPIFPFEPPILEPPTWNALPDEKKIEFLYKYAVSARRANQTLASAVEALQKRLAAIENKRPGNP
jgi:hypothetical protein